MPSVSRVHERFTSFRNIVSSYLYAIHSVTKSEISPEISAGFSGIGANEKRGCHRYLRETEIELDRETCLG